jgi:NAD(P)-dependent dehydrogenase (short-subunit alcohol dehydrogenase family)
VAAVAVHLASHSARNITGCMFPVDGGTMPY